MLQRNQYISVFIFSILFISVSLSAQTLNKKHLDSLLSEDKNYTALKEINSYDTLKLSKPDLALFYLYNAKCLAAENKNARAFQLYLQAKNAFFNLDLVDEAMQINLDIAFYLINESTNRKKAHKYIQEYLNYALKKNDDLLIGKAYLSWASLELETNPLESLKLFKKSIYYSEKANNINQLEALYSNLGVLYNEMLQKPDSAIFYIDKSIILNKKIKNNHGIAINLINMASCYYYKEDYLKAITFLEKAKEIKISKNGNHIKGYIYQFLAINHNELGNYKEAYENLNNYITIHEDLNIEKQDIKISEFNIKYETKEKEIENLRLIAKVQRNQIITYSSVGILLIAILISFLVYKNLSKKKKIAEQAELIQTQKLEKTLKDRALHDIDLMLKSQEIERQQIANELHDNLGSLLATLKLNFQNINRSENQDDQKLFEKTEALLDETYQKVRNMAHLKNMGVIGKEGLLVAVNKMAEKMSILNKIQFNVIPFGLNQRLKNTTDVTIFRIIQELCTNIIKHAEANEVNIYLTQQNTELINIIIEDNGKGFDYKLISKKDGIGLKSIEQKVEQMGGTFTVDSIVYKGTTIIVDLPV